MGRFPGCTTSRPQARVPDSGISIVRGSDEALRRGHEGRRSDPPQLVEAINGLTDFLRAERKRVPRDVLWEAERLECLVFSGYDPHFDGDEPPGF